MKELSSGHYLLTLKGPWRDGTTHLKFGPIELQRRPLALTRCGGRLRHVATLLDAASARALLAHLGLPVREPPPAPAGKPPFWAVTREEFFEAS